MTDTQQTNGRPRAKRLDDMQKVQVDMVRRCVQNLKDNGFARAAHHLADDHDLPWRLFL